MLKRIALLIITLAVSARVFSWLPPTLTEEDCLYVWQTIFETVADPKYDSYLGEQYPFLWPRPCRITGFRSYLDDRPGHPDWWIEREGSERQVLMEGFHWYSFDRWMNEANFLATYYRTDVRVKNYNGQDIPHIISQ